MAIINVYSGAIFLKLNFSVKFSAYSNCIVYIYSHSTLNNFLFKTFGGEDVEFGVEPSPTTR